MALAVMSGSVALMGLVAVAFVLLVLGSFLVQSALSGIYSAALYRYAANGQSGLGFENGELQAAFQPK